MRNYSRHLGFYDVKLREFTSIKVFSDSIKLFYINYDF